MIPAGKTLHISRVTEIRKIAEHYFRCAVHIFLEEHTSTVFMIGSKIVKDSYCDVSVTLFLAHQMTTFANHLCMERANNT